MNPEILFKSLLWVGAEGYFHGVHMPRVDPFAFKKKKSASVLFLYIERIYHSEERDSVVDSNCIT